MKIIVDTREPELYRVLEILAEEGHTNKSGVIITRRLLEIGDVHITSDDESITHLVIERKTMDDLAASISDGRWSEQKKRALSSFTNRQLFYVIQVKDESEIFEYQNRYSKVKCDSLLSASMNLVLNYNIPYVYLKKIENVARYIYRLAIQCEKKQDQKKTEYTDSYLGSIKSQKQKNMTHDVFFQYCLQGVPGISNKTAKNICALFDHCFSSFFDTIRDDTSCQILQILYKETYGRNLSKTIVKNISNLFLSDPTIPSDFSIQLKETSSISSQESESM
jgi:ERCC4-type nuclease